MSLLLMATADVKHSLAADSGYALPRLRGLNRRALCLADASLEGAVAALIVLATASAYHTLVLGDAPADFAWRLYLASALLAGLSYGAFAWVSCARLLDGRELRWANLPESFYAWTAAVALLLLAAFLAGHAGRLSRVSLTSAYLVGIPALLAVRGFLHPAMSARIRRGELRFDRLAVIGRRVDVVDFLLTGELWRHGYHLSGALYLEDIEELSPAERNRAVADFARLSLKRQAEHLVIVTDLSDLDGMERLVRQLRRFALNVVAAPASSNRTLKFLDVVAIGPNNALRFLRKPMSDGAVILKRAMDIAGAGFGLVLLSPVLAGAALAILLTMGRPIIYKQERRGFNGEPFLIWKFRSMNVTESGHAMVQAEANDPRITPVGKFLRSSSIDELPQLINVLMGQMSLVGPRPHALSHDAALEREVENYAHRQRIKPGITGWAQVNGYRGETKTVEQSAGRTRHDLYYIDNWSILFDIWILMLTVLSPATRRNAR
ncbi:MAG TPA: sugar transferase [Devosiaceae bacterium]|nr:sugar transferase [Devosiaceae bacterium]